jgi:hypothetical protein
MPGGVGGAVSDGRPYPDMCFYSLFAFVVRWLYNLILINRSNKKSITKGAPINVVSVSSYTYVPFNMEGIFFA